MRATTKDIYGGRDPIELPVCSLSEGAAWLQLPVSTVRAWALGQASAAGAKRSPPVIEIADAARRDLSFQNLVELHVLAAIRRQHRISLQNVRKAVAFLRKRLGTRHPLAARAMLTDGRDLLVEIGPDLVNASRAGQFEMAIVDAYLERIEFNKRGELLRLYPFTSQSLATDRRSVVIDPRIQFGRPCLRGTGVPTAVVAERFLAGESIASLVEDYGIAAAQIEEALRYEQAARAA